MVRSAASKAERAAEALDVFLRDRPAAAVSADPGQAATSSQEGDGAVGDDGGVSIQRRALPAGTRLTARPLPQEPRCGCRTPTGCSIASW